MLEIIGIYLMGVLFVIAVFAKMISYFTVRKMVKAASEIQKSNHKFMRLIKAKFEHASLVSDKVQNIGAFVEKYLYEHKVLGIKMHTLRSFPQKIGWIIFLLGGACAFSCYREEQLGAQTVEYIQWTSVFVLTILLLHYLLDEDTRMSAARNYIVEYLENVCVHRYEKSGKLGREEEVTEKVLEAEPVEEPEERKKSEQEVRIRAILEEFLA